MATILVAYASRHGATREIAERIGGTLVAGGHTVTVRRAADCHIIDGYDAFVAGGAAYMGGWLKDVRDFVEQHRPTLMTHPVWLFSSGPSGNAPDLLRRAEPHDFADYGPALQPRDMRVFAGRLDPELLWASEKSVLAEPGVQAVLHEGDFRNWAEIDAWAQHIAAALPTEVPATTV
jgi:menaquinone-dependent protoporphyrinogen oxidase